MASVAFFGDVNLGAIGGLLDDAGLEVDSLEPIFPPTRTVVLYCEEAGSVLFSLFVFPALLVIVSKISLDFDRMALFIVIPMPEGVKESLDTDLLKVSNPRAAVLVEQTDEGLFVRAALLGER